MKIDLFPVPKKLGVIKEINPAAFAISYKLETDVEILDSKATMSLKKYKMDMVIANLLQTFQKECTIYRMPQNADDSTIPEKTHISQNSDNQTSIEAKIISEILNYI